MTDEAPGARGHEIVLVQPSSWSPDGVANLRAAHDALRRLGPLGERHIVVLPELIGSATDEPTYLAELRAITATTGAWLIGGSHYRSVPATNTGYALAPDGTVAHRYEKLNPYGAEHDHGVQAGTTNTTGRIAGLNVTVLICADAWFAEHLLDQPTTLDLVIIPSFSVTRRPAAFARALWRHLAITRAYEFTTYIALADYRPGVTHHGTPAAGTSGIADPAPDRPDRYFTPAAERPASTHHVDTTKLHTLRGDRIARGFVRLTSNLRTSHEPAPQPARRPTGDNARPYGQHEGHDANGHPVFP